MADQFIVDTHALIWFLAGSHSLGAKAKKILEDEKSQLVLPAIVLAEACWIIQRRRLNLSVNELLKAIDRDARFIISPLDREIIEQSLTLDTISEMHDQLIVATGLVVANQGYSVALLTHDQDITASSQPLPTIW